MGQISSLEEEAHLRTLTHKLSKIELSDLESVFQELSSTHDGKAFIKQPTWLNRDVFAEKFGLPEFVVEQMFEAFDRDKNGVIDADEFMMGMALCLHGSINDKCRLLFKMFSLNGDDGISRTELTTVLTSALRSAEMLLAGSTQTDPSMLQRTSSQSGEALKISVAVDRIVKDAFLTCDLHKTGKLNIEEFAHWVYKNPRLVNNIFVVQCPKPSHNRSVVAGATPEIVVSPEGFPKNPTSSALPQSATVGSPKRNRLNELFQGAPAHHSVEEQFFNNLPGLVAFEDKPSPGELSRGDGIEQLARPRSVCDISQQLRGHAPTSLALGGSEEDLDRLSLAPPRKAGMLLFASPSMQSIALSRDSLAEKLPSEAVRNGEVTLKENQREPLQFSAAPLLPENTNALTIPGSQIAINFDVFGDAPSNPVLDSVTVDMYVSTAEADTFGFASTGFQKGLSEQTSEKDPIWHPLQPARPHFILNDMEDDLLEPSQFGRDTNLVDHVFEYGKVGKGVSEEGSEQGLEQAGILEDLRLKRSSVVESGVEAEESDSVAGNSYQRLFLAEVSSQVGECGFHSYWPASQQTRILFQVAESGQDVQHTLLTFPSALVDGVVGDPVRDLVSKYLGEQEASKRPTLTLDSVPFTDDGLRRLLQAGCWRAGLDFTLKFLSAHGQGLLKENSKPYSAHTPKLLQIWFVRIAILVKLRMFSSAEAEINAFGDFDAPDLFYEFYPKLYPGKIGSMVPFSLRLLHAELPQHNGRRGIALDRLYAMLDKVKDILKNLDAGLLEDGSGLAPSNDLAERKNLWLARHLRVMYSIGNCFLGMEEYHLAIKIFEQIVTIRPERKASILSGIGRICLQFGDIVGAQKTFRRVDEVVLGDPNSLSMVTMNKGFLALALGSYEEAFMQFQSAAKLNPDNLSASNNAAVSLIYLGKVKEACSMLEHMVWRNPDRSLSEDVLFNLCTIYELETSRALQKKHKLLDLVSKHCGDGFNVQCLKLT